MGRSIRAYSGYGVVVPHDFEEWTKGGLVPEVDKEDETRWDEDEDAVDPIDGLLELVAKFPLLSFEQTWYYDETTAIAVMVERTSEMFWDGDPVRLASDRFEVTDEEESQLKAVVKELAEVGCPIEWSPEIIVLYTYS